MTAALGFAAAALSISLVWPQVWLSCRRGRTRGLSPTACWLAVGLNVCWMTFGLLAGDPAQVVTNVVVGIGNSAVLVALLLTQPQLRTRAVLLRSAAGAAGLATVAASGVGAVVVFGAASATVAPVLGAVVSLVAAAAACVQPLTLLLDRTVDLSGISATRYRLGACANASWVGYGWLREQPEVFLASGIGLGCALVVCTLLVTRRRTPAVVALPGRRAALAAA
jgi:uncharacterized protein with PQ loop repeat